MADEAAGYIHLLDLAVDWANAGGLPKEMVLRRLCEWAVMGAFPPGALVDRFGNKIAPLEMLKDFRAAMIDGGSVTLGGWTMCIDPSEALSRLCEIRVVVNDVHVFCERVNTPPPPLMIGGIRRFWVARGGKSLAPPACPAADEEADRQESRRCAEILLNSLRNKLHGLKGKPSITGSHRTGPKEPINFNFWGADWAEARALVMRSIERAGDDDDELRCRLDELDAEWVAFVQAQARSAGDLAWATRVTESRSDWHEMIMAARIATEEEFQADALAASTTAAAEFSEIQQNSAAALADPPRDNKPAFPG